MVLWKYNNAITVTPGRDSEEAVENYEIMSGGAKISESRLEILVPPEDYERIFLIAYTLAKTPGITPDQLQALTQTYADQIGYSLTNTEIYFGFTRWVYRFIETAEEDTSSWLK